MTRKSIVEREDKRIRLVKFYSNKYKELKDIATSAKYKYEERRKALMDLQKIPRNANPHRLRNRCGITGRPRGTFRQFGLGRTKIREMAFEGLIPGITKSSW